ncbi:hypothetical protein KIPB_002776 [Kipferlia bialata]|uniref:Uncharacterized protein n=1 Tax=Kipferlia bialata TaxID=797122 RepID=A0A391NJE8_9EUKA|nr:hypothetical protein KIPB_002197 [Kipferlia bialata]GCA62267.1 hypothetical protein KIPB_002438 [Kipferlia bialata]GCA62318.1 hypothetical protein KIPB_002776 [Kipferlia bialata]|eukprot:g2197.t1
MYCNHIAAPVLTPESLSSQLCAAVSGIAILKQKTQEETEAEERRERDRARKRQDAQMAYDTLKKETKIAEEEGEAEILRLERETQAVLAQQQREVEALTLQLRQVTNTTLRHNLQAEDLRNEQQRLEARDNARQARDSVTDSNQRQAPSSAYEGTFTFGTPGRDRERENPPHVSSRRDSVMSGWGSDAGSVSFTGINEPDREREREVTYTSYTSRNSTPTHSRHHSRHHSTHSLPHVSPPHSMSLSPSHTHTGHQVHAARQEGREGQSRDKPRDLPLPTLSFTDS